MMGAASRAYFILWNLYTGLFVLGVLCDGIVNRLMYSSQLLLVLVLIGVYVCVSLYVCLLGNE